MQRNDNPPTRSEILTKLRMLFLEDEDSRDDVSDWARPWVTFRADEIEDIETLRILEKLASANLPACDREYLYGKHDFIAWLTEAERTS